MLLQRILAMMDSDWGVQVAGRAVKWAKSDFPHDQIPELKIFPRLANSREQDMKKPSNFDYNSNVTLRVTIIVLL